MDVSEIELAAAAALRESSRPRLVVVDDKRVAASTQLMKIERITLKGRRKKKCRYPEQAAAESYGRLTAN
ncbi:hypothetical protein AU511_10860 [Lonsdalea iberica]|uniref:Uncharacterized protein n=1 Tax=Lonsdalea iberica TaxID=1082703 RepID=A0A1X3RT66_9GAMM|nr:hypothetical protein AU511_10860 [Lonsdalea iberica]